MKHTLCLGTGLGFDIPTLQQIPAIGRAGFDGVFTGWEPGWMDDFAAAAQKAGLLYQSVHAPFSGVNPLWEDPGSPGDLVVDGLCRCADDCARVHVPIMVCHAVIGMEKCTPTQLGIRRFARLVEYTRHLGVVVAFENIEGEEYLAAVLDAFRSCDNVRFCLDSGHELCYNHGRDMLALYGDRLAATHLNDNLGMTDPAARTPRDDLHLLPFDGRVDWPGLARRLRLHRYRGPLTFELTRAGKPGRHEHDAYQALSFEEYLALALERARRFAQMV